MPRLRDASVTLLALLLTVAPTACSDDDGTAPVGDVTGTYTLETIGGEQLPAVEFEDEQKRSEVQSASITLRSD
ncbi:MAG TPA: hypothetical protein VMK65_11715, partial [Longimicrobiales bacterium]|nr:hypothetical protein [Longimicrobiales bacterium]